MMWQCNGYPQQTWGWDGNTNKIYIYGGSSCLDWYQDDYDNGQWFHIWGCNEHWNQYWDLWDSPDPSGGGGGGGGGGGQSSDMFNSCDDQSGGSWGVFQDKNSLSSDGQWASYFTSVYGGVPDFGYPICLSGFRVLHLDALKSAGISISQSGGSNPGDYQEGKEYKSAYVGYIKHADCQNQCFNSNQWVEGLHCGTSEEKHSAWYYFATGSGVWIWSGTTKAWSTRKDFQSDMGFSSCSGTPKFECGGDLFKVAHDSHGLDTVQYLHEGYSQGNGNPMFIDTQGVGTNTCGRSSCPWKAGWGATQSCSCDNSKTCQNCGGYSSPGCYEDYENAVAVV